MIELIVIIFAFAWYASGLLYMIYYNYEPPNNFFKAMINLTMWPWYFDKR